MSIMELTLIYKALKALTLIFQRFSANLTQALRSTEKVPLQIQLLSNLLSGSNLVMAFFLKRCLMGSYPSSFKHVWNANT